MSIEDVFFLRDGHTVLAGRIEEGEMAVIEPGPATILVNGQRFATIQIEREPIVSHAAPMARHEIRAAATRDATGLTKDMVASNQCKLEGPMRYSGHRHLVGIDSPPADYVADDMTLGPRLPEGWDGDAWMKPGGEGYFLRAWSKSEARYATALSDKYEQARQMLLDEIAAGAKKVEIRTTETKASPA